MNTFRWEWTTIAALIAPRPMLFANSDNDPIFPMDGNRRIIARLREAYKMLGKPDLVEEYVSKGGHDYRPDLRLAIFRFFDRHLMGVKREIKDADDEPLPGQRLRAFPKDADIPKDAINGKVDETFVPVAADCRRRRSPRSDGGTWRSTGSRCGFWTSPRRGSRSQAKPRRSSRRFPAARSTRPRATPSRSSRTPSRRARRATPRARSSSSMTTTRTAIIPAWAKAHVGEGEVRLIRPRGTGPTRWTRKNPPNYVERCPRPAGPHGGRGRMLRHRLLRRDADRSGRTAPSGRSSAGARRASWAPTRPCSCPEVERVVVIDPPKSHRDGPYLLGIQRHFDIPAGLGLLAPGRSSSSGRRTRRSTRRPKSTAAPKAADKLTRK